MEKASAKAGRFEFPFGKLDPHERRLTKGAAYPILGAFRNYVEIDAATEKARWIGGFENVKKVWEEVGPVLVKETREATEEIGNSPDALGKNRNHWSNLFKTVKLHLMEERLDRMDEGAV